MKKRIFTITLMLAALLLVLSSGCKQPAGANPSTGSVTSTETGGTETGGTDAGDSEIKVTVTPKVTSTGPGELPLPFRMLNVGKSETYTANVTPEDATDKTVTWKAEPAEAVEVTVNEDGTCTVKGIKSGDVKLTATSNADSTKSDVVNIKISAPKETLTISGPTEANMKDTVTLEATITPPESAGKKITWSILDPDNKSVDGTLKGFPNSSTKISFKVEQTGTFTVTATTEDGSCTATHQIQVTITEGGWKPPIPGFN